MSDDNQWAAELHLEYRIPIIFFFSCCTMMRTRDGR